MKILNFYKSSTIQKELKMSYIRTQNAAKIEKIDGVRLRGGRAGEEKQSIGGSRSKSHLGI